MTAEVTCVGNGAVLKGWDGFVLRDAFDDPLGSAEFSTQLIPSRSFEYNQLLAKGEAIRVSVDGKPQGTWIITTRSPRISRDGGVSLRVTARSPLCTAYEGSVDPTLSFSTKTDAPVEKLVLDALKPYGFTSINADPTPTINAMAGAQTKGRRATISTAGLKAADLKAHDGESAYQFAARIYTRLGLCLRVDVYGGLLLAAPDYDQQALYSVHQTFAGAVEGSDRLLDGIEITDTNESQFSECVCRGQSADVKGKTQTARPAARVIGAGSTSVRPASAPFGAIVATELDDAKHRYRSPANGAPYKPLIITDKSSRDNLRCASTAKLALGLRARSGYVIQCEVDGFTAKTGALWTVDTVVRVRIDAEGIDEDMWIVERTFEQSRARGQVTRLTIIPKYSLVLGDIPS